MTMPTDKRDASLDAAAGMLILVVLLGHANLLSKSDIHSIGYFFAYYMAWFFFKAGMFHRTKKRNYDFVKGLILRLGVPYIVFFLVGCIFDGVVSLLSDPASFSLLGSAYGYIARAAYLGADWSNIALWFLLSLFFIKLICASYTGKNTLVWLIIPLIVAYAHCLYVPFEKFTYIGNIALGIVFYIAGYQLRSIQYRTDVMWMATVIAVVLFFVNPSAIDLFSNSVIIGNYFQSILWFIAMIIMTNNAFKKIPVMQNKVLRFCGLNSMLILVAHVPIINIVRRIHSGWLPDLGDEILWHVLEAAVSLFVVAMLYLLIRQVPRLKVIIGE